MIVKSFLVLLAFCSCVLLIQKSMAVRLSPYEDDFIIGNHRTRTRQNYMVQRAIDEELSANIDNMATLSEAIDAEAISGDLSSQVMDCAKMIRNEIIYSDNSLEATARKRGIMKKNFAMAAPPCSCASEREEIFLGDNFFPVKLDSRKCAETCSGMYHCKAINYWVIVLKRLEDIPRQSHERLIHAITYQSGLDMPHDLQRWEAHRVNITTSCMCTADEIEINLN